MEQLIDLINTIPSDAWTAIATALLTSGIAYFGISFTNKENMKRMKSQHDHERQLRLDEVNRARAEELYVSIRKFCKTMVSDHFPYLRVMKGQFDYNNALDMTLERGEKSNFDPERIYMIADIYYPGLSKKIDDLVELNGKVHDIRETFKKKYEKGKTKDEKMASIYLTAINELIDHTHSLESEVGNYIKNI